MSRMTREEAIELLENLKVCKQAHTLFNIEKEAVDMAIKSLKEETICPILSDDEVKQPCIKSPCGFERPHGEWEKKTDGVPHLVTIEWFVCSECGVQKSEGTPFCPNCGADMRKEGDEK